MRESFRKVEYGRARTMRLGCWLAIVAWSIQSAAMAPVCLAERGDKLVVHLYFADARNPYLVAESRVMIDPDDPLELGRRIIAELLGGSSAGNLSVIPHGTQLRSFFLLDGGTAVVDFNHSFKENHPDGCRLEQLTLFSVVNSLILNVADINRVKILIDGTETQTLAGHLVLEFPLTADMLLTR